MRTIDTAAGSEYLTAVVTETFGQSLEDATVEVAMSESNTNPPHTGWAAADLVAVDGPVMTASVLVDSGTDKITRGYLWVRVTDNPEVIPRCCHNDSITIL